MPASELPCLPTALLEGFEKDVVGQNHHFYRSPYLRSIFRRRFIMSQDPVFEISHRTFEYGLQEFFGTTASHHNGTSSVRSSAMSSLLLLSPLLTGYLGVFVSLAISYSFFDVILSLATVETRSNVPLQPNLLSDDKGYRSKVRQADRDRFITSSIRSTWRHLAVEAGDLSMLRGMGTDFTIGFLHLPIYGVVSWILQRPFSIMHASFLLPTFSTIVSSIVLCQVHTAWLHIVITKPSHRFWFRRLPLTWRTVLNAVGLLLIAHHLIDTVADHVPSLGSYLFGSGGNLGSDMASVNGTAAVTQSPSAASINVTSVQYKLIRYAISLAVTTLLKMVFGLPIRAALLRTMASLLPLDDETIVPIDRSFSDGPNSGILAQAQPLSWSSAWNSVGFNTSTHWRLARLYAKLFAIQKGVELGFWLAALLQLGAAMGPEIMWIFLKGWVGVPLVHSDADGLSDIAAELFGDLFLANQTIVANATEVLMHPLTAISETAGPL